MYYLLSANRRVVGLKVTILGSSYIIINKKKCNLREKTVYDIKNNCGFLVAFDKK